MIKKMELNFQSTKNGIKELKNRIIFVIIAIIIFRIGSFIPTPVINSKMLSKLFDHQKGTIIEMFNMFSGGALSRASIFALGIMPYISSSIIIQLLSAIHPKLSEIKKDGENGRRKINQYTRYGTLILAILQSIGISTGLPNMIGIEEFEGNLNFSFYFTAVISLVTGTMFLMWLGEQITEKGIGNGISIIIYIGIVAGLPESMGHTIEQVRQGNLHFLILIIIVLLMFFVTYFVVFMERAQRKVIVNYAKRQQGRRIYSAQSTHLPLKLNMAGVIPAIFASSILLFVGTIISWFGEGTGWIWLKKIIIYFQPGRIIYIIIYSSAIIFFCFFYTALVFSPRETADNLKKSGAFIPGIRPGENTAKYIDKIMTRLTLIGSIYVTFICLIPEFMRDIIKVPFYFGSTSLLIVVVIIDFITQIQTLMMSSQYESVLKKANLKNK